MTCSQHHACDDDDDDVKALLQDAMWYLSEEFRTNYHDQLVEQQDDSLALNDHVQVLKVLKHHLDCPKRLQAHALHTLMNATHDHKELCIQFTALDLQTILASMKINSCHTSIQFLGLAVHSLLISVITSKIQVAFDNSLDGISSILQIIGHFSTILVSWKRRATAFTDCRVCVKYGVRKLLLASLMRTRDIGNGCGETNCFSQSSAALDALNFLTTRL
jgi:hypothetical protein